MSDRRELPFCRNIVSRKPGRTKIQDSEVLGGGTVIFCVFG